MTEIIAEVVVLALIVNTFKGLQLINEDIIGAIEDASQELIIWRSLLVIGGLFFVRWQMSWLPDAVQAALYVIIAYETVNAAALLFFRNGYLDFLKSITQTFSAAPKIPVAAELLVLCYIVFLVLKDILSLFVS